MTSGAAAQPASASALSMHWAMGMGDIRSGLELLALWPLVYQGRPALAKGGIDGPAGPAFAGPLRRAQRNAGPLFLLLANLTPPTL